MQQSAVHASYVFGIKGIFVLFNHRTKPMAIVVQKYANDGQTAHAGPHASAFLLGIGFVGFVVSSCCCRLC